MAPFLKKYINALPRPNSPRTSIPELSRSRQAIGAVVIAAALALRVGGDPVADSGPAARADVLEELGDLVDEIIEILDDDGDGDGGG